MVGESVTLHTDIEAIKRNDHILWLFGSDSPGTRIAEIIKWSYMLSIYVCHKERFGDQLQLDHQTGSLTIENISTEHSGLYKLTINNNGKTSNRRFRLKVYGEKIFSIDEITQYLVGIVCTSIPYTVCHYFRIFMQYFLSNKKFTWSYHIWPLVCHQSITVCGFVIYYHTLQSGVDFFNTWLVLFLWLSFVRLFYICCHIFQPIFLFQSLAMTLHTTLQHHRDLQVQNVFCCVLWRMYHGWLFPFTKEKIYCPTSMALILAPFSLCHWKWIIMMKTFTAVS